MRPPSQDFQTSVKEELLIFYEAVLLDLWASFTAHWLLHESLPRTFGRSDSGNAIRTAAGFSSGLALCTAAA